MTDSSWTKILTAWSPKLMRRVSQASSTHLLKKCQTFDPDEKWKQLSTSWLWRLCENGQSSSSGETLKTRPKLTNSDKKIVLIRLRNVKCISHQHRFPLRYFLKFIRQKHKTSVRCSGFTKAGRDQSENVSKSVISIHFWSDILHNTWPHCHHQMSSSLFSLFGIPRKE